MAKTRHGTVVEQGYVFVVQDDLGERHCLNYHWQVTMSCPREVGSRVTLHWSTGPNHAFWVAGPFEAKE